MALRRYAALLEIPGARSLLFTSVFARLGFGITSLALLLLISGRSGTYAPAAVAASVYALASAAAAPMAGRLADRLGPTPVLRVTAVAHPAALLLLLGATYLDPMSLPLVWIAAGLGGATFPPLTAAVRGAWNAVTRAGTQYEDLRPVGLSAESSLIELVFVVGPILVAGFVAFADAGAAIIFAAVSTLIGTWLVAASPAIRERRPHPSQPRTRGLGPLREAGFPALLCCCAGLGYAFGAAGVAVPAYATSTGSANADSVAGILLAVWGVGSAVGGIWYGTRHFTTALTRQYTWLLVAVGTSLAVFAVMPNAVALGVALTLGGATIAPALTVNTYLIGRIVADRMHNEAYTWAMTISVAFSALGGVVTGLIVDISGTGWAFAVSALAVGLAAIVTAWPDGPITRAEARSAVAREAHDPELRDNSKLPE